MKSPVMVYDGCIYETDVIIKYLIQLTSYNTWTKWQKTWKQRKNRFEEMIQMLFPHSQLEKEIQMANLYW